MGLKSTYDRANDVLYVKQEGCQIINSKESPDDSMLILNYDRTGKTVGIQLLFAGELVDAPHYVDDYPLTDEFKAAIRHALNLSTPGI